MKIFLFLFIGNAIAYNISEILRSIKNPEEQTLNLNDFALTLTDIVTIVTALKKTPITKLFLGNNGLGDEGITVLTNCVKNSQITVLVLSKNNITSRGAAALANILNQTRITYLFFGNNNIGNEGVSAIARVLKYTRITHLELSYNNIDDEGAIILAKSLIDTRIIDICVGGQAIGDRGAIGLAKGLVGSPVIGLKLWFTEIGDDGIRAIADSLSKTVITELSFTHTRIGDRGIRAIAEVLNGTGVMYLTLYENQVSRASAEFLMSVLEGTQVEKLDIWDRRYETSHEDVQERISDLCARNRFRMERLYQQLGDFVTTKKGSLEFNIDRVYENVTEYIEFVRIIAENKAIYARRFISEGRTKYTQHQIHDFVHNVEYRLSKCQRKSELISEHFKKFLIVDNGSLEFIVDYAYAMKSDYVEFARRIANNRADYIQRFVFEGRRNYTETQIQDFVGNIEKRLSECFRKSELISEQFKRYVATKNGSLGFVIDYAFSNKSEYVEFTSFVTRNKPEYRRRFISEAVRNYGENQIEDFVDNIEARVSECLCKSKLTDEQFEKFVVSKEGSLEFYVDHTNPRKFEYLDFTFRIVEEKQSWMNYFISKRTEPRWMYQVQDFVGNIHQRLIEFFGKINQVSLDMSILCTCSKVT